MNVYKQRLLNVARALRESPAPLRFTMTREFHSCGTPACAWGHYVARTDLQNSFARVPDGHGTAFYEDKSYQVTAYGIETQQHFGLSYMEAEELFGMGGCDRARTPQKAVAYIEAFAARKWPEPAKRTDSELVSALMARVTSGERIPEDA